MTTSDFISIGSLFFAVAAFIYSYLTSTKKYELTSQYRAEILGWYAGTLDILMRLKMEAMHDIPDQGLKNELLSGLSVKIETGRFYFPNIDKGDKFGEGKPLAYQGYRNLMLDFLVFSYQIFEQEEAKKYIKHAEILQRHFTSHLFDILDPKAFLKETEKYTAKSFSKELRFEDFINNDPESLNAYF
jgi:hypothetical protein